MGPLAEDHYGFKTPNLLLPGKMPSCKAVANFGFELHRGTAVATF
jgi:hypothetical protein